MAKLVTRALSCIQAEQEVQNLTRKLKLLETDLEQSEDKAQDSDKKLRVAEAQVEELQREKRQLENQIGILESEFCVTLLCASDLES